eukprot:2190379-Ditylum_brightwellii.AAC.1
MEFVMDKNGENVALCPVMVFIGGADSQQEVVHKHKPNKQTVTNFFSTVQTAPDQPTSPNDLQLYNNADTAPIPAL